jgi:hypothetical protein
VSAIPDGLLHWDECLLKTPEYGGWYLGQLDFLDHMYLAIRREDGWEWEKVDDETHKEAVLIAPLILLVWDD